MDATHPSRFQKGIPTQARNRLAQTPVVEKKSQGRYAGVAQLIDWVPKSAGQTVPDDFLFPSHPSA